MLYLTKKPWLQMPDTQGVTVFWETNVKTPSQVFVYRTQKPICEPTAELIRVGEPTVFEGAAARIHQVRVSGLAPGCDYSYDVCSGEAQSGPHSFRTAPAAGVPFSFGVTAECGGYADDAVNQATARAMSNFRPDFLLFAGDMVHDGLRAEDWDRYLFGPFARMLPDTPFYLCPGNHEKDAPLYYELTGFPKPGNYYTFEYGDACFIALDSTKLALYSGHWPADKKLLPPGDIGPGSEQYDFLEKTLAACRKTWKFVFFHYPVYVSGMWGVEYLNVFCPLFERYGVDAAFTSHSMVYERSRPITGDAIDPERGVVYYVIGAAGAVRDGKYPNWFYPKRAWHTAESFIAPHFLQADVAGDRLEIRTRGLQGELLDVFIKTKAKTGDPASEK